MLVRLVAVGVMERASINYLLRKMKNAGSLMPVVIKGRGAKYKAVPAKQS